MRRGRAWVGQWVMAAGVIASSAGPALAQPSPEARQESPAAAASASEAARDRFIEERMREAGMVGLAASILVDGTVVWTKGYGFADREAGRAFTPDTVLNVGSISKTVIGVALLRAVEAGKLRLDDDVQKHVPFPVRNPRHPGVPITLRQLATHTSGIADRDSVYADSYHQGGDSPVALAGFLRDYLDPQGRLYSADNFVAARPGRFREYSNVGAALAAYAVERAAGVPFGELTRREIFRPLHMTSTGWLLAEVDRAQHAALYDAGSGTAARIPLYGLTTWPDGGLRTSVRDLSRFFAMLLAGGEHAGARILAPASLEEMLRFQYTAENRPENVQLDEKNSGIFWSTKMDVTFVGHGGTDPGVHAEMLAEPSRRVGVVLVTNTTLGAPTMKSFYSVFKALMAEGRGRLAR